MDHLPPVLNQKNPVRVPYLGGRYTGEPFTEYPSKKGWKVEQLQGMSAGDPLRADAAKFLQEWLYFGLMKSLLQVPFFNEEDFIDASEHEGGPCITTQQLPRYLDAWKASIEAMKQDESSERCTAYKTEVVATLAASHNAWYGFKDFVGVTGGEIELAIIIMGTTLEHAITTLTDISVDQALWRLTKSAWLHDRMMKVGWCPTTLDQIFWPAHETVVYYASLFGPPVQPSRYKGAELRHTECLGAYKECQRRIFNEETYETAHENPECQCEFAGPVAKELRDIIAKKDRWSKPEAELGSIPLVYWDDNKSTIVTVEYTPDKQYTAISHVWSDGLGNTNGNALPMCQIKRLTRWIKEMPFSKVQIRREIPFDDRVWRPYEEYVATRDVVQAKGVDEPTYDPEFLKTQPLYFWIDTLCVPRKDVSLADEGDSYRKAALKQMGAVYSRANRVLILDSDLLSVEGEESKFGIQEVVIRLAVSTWMRRLWTLQEFVLGKIVWWRFKDSLFRPDPARELNKETEEKYWNNEIGLFVDNLELFQFGYYARFLSRDLPESTAIKISMVWKCLKNRCVTRTEDEPYLVSMLLGMDTNELLSVEAEQRIAKHWSMYTHIPAGLFMNPGRKQTQPGIRWAPLTISDCADHVSPRLHLAQRNSAGDMELILHGILIDRIDGGESGVRSVISLQLGGEKWYIRQNLNRGNDGWEKLDFGANTPYAAIIGAQPLQAEQERLPEAGYLVALVSIRKTEADGTMVVKWERVSSLLKAGSRFDVRAPWTEVQVAEKKMSPVMARYTPFNQKWVIT